MSKQKRQVRDQFRTAVFARDKHTCVFCDCTDDLDAHHIRDRSKMPNGGYVLSNGITLCPVHHQMAERFHISEGTEWNEGMHPDDLYRLIGSSYERAVEDANKGT